jgi:hypothetical protein
MSQSPPDPFALVKLEMSQAQQQHNRVLGILERTRQERAFGYKQLQDSRMRNDRFYMNTQGRADKAFWENYANSMGEMTFGAFMSDVRAQRAASTPPLFMFDDKDMVPNPEADRIFASAGPGAANSIPGTIAPSAQARKSVKEEPRIGEKGSPHAGPVQPRTGEPGGPAGPPEPEQTEEPDENLTPQQQRVQQVRSKAGQNRQSQPTPMQAPRLNLNAVHVDPVTGQMFGNIKGHFVPMDNAAWNVLQDWQRSSIASYNAETSRYRANSLRRSVDAQDGLLGALTRNSNRGMLTELVASVPGFPEIGIGMLERASDIFDRDTKSFKRHLGELAGAFQAGDMEMFRSALADLEEEMYNTQKEKIDKKLKDENSKISTARKQYNEGGDKSLLSDIAKFESERRRLTNESMSLVHPSNTGPMHLPTNDNPNKPSTPAGAVSHNVLEDWLIVNNLDYREAGDLIKSELQSPQEEAPLLQSYLDALRAEFEKSGLDIRGTETQFYTHAARQFGIDAKFNEPITATLPTHMQPQPPVANNEMGAATQSPITDTGEIDLGKLQDLRDEYMQSLNGEQPTEETWNSFLRSKNISNFN